MVLQQRSFSLRGNYIITISILYWLISLIIFSKYGIKFVIDSPRYIEYASNLAQGFYFDPHNFWYIGYAIFIFLVRIINEDLMTIAICQYLLSYLAVIALFKTSIIIFKNERVAFISAFLYIFFIEIISWNSYILPESLYLSAICFSLYVLVLIYYRQVRLYLYIVAIIVIPFSVLMKPTGISLLGALLVCLVYYIVKKMESKMLRCLFTSIVCIAFLLLVNRMLHTYLIMENYEKGEIIYAITTLPYNSDYDPLILTPPAGLYLPPDHYPPIIKILSFIYHHPVYWFHLFFTKMFYFFGHIRPYWSWYHNLFSILFLLPAYFYFFKSLVKCSVPFMISLFSMAYVILHVLSVCITSEDWDGRFLLPLLPVLFILCSKGFFEILKAIRDKIVIKIWY